MTSARPSTGAVPAVAIQEPDPKRAPGFRSALAELSKFKVTDCGDGHLILEPSEGVGEIREYFEVIEVCDADSDLANSDVLQVIRKLDVYRRQPGGDLGYCERIREQAVGLLPEDETRREYHEFAACRLLVAAACEDDTVAELMVDILPNLFERFPKGKLLLVKTDPVLLARLAFARSQMSQQLAPDVPIEKFEGMRSFESMTLSLGVSFFEIVGLPLMATSPLAMGAIIPMHPHCLVFCAGEGMRLSEGRRSPRSMGELFNSGPFSDSRGLDRSRVVEGAVDIDSAELMHWWVNALNVHYSRIADPTNWVDSGGYFDASEQVAWHVTFERILGDLLALLSDPYGLELTRVQSAFDVLDKAPQLLGYTRKKEAQGFKDLLRKDRIVTVAREAFRAAPGEAAAWLGDEVEELMAGMYESVLDGVVSQRKHEAGIEVEGDGGSLELIATDDFVVELMRAIRNSSHGVLSILRSDRDRRCLVISDCRVPLELPAVAALIGFALIADPIRLMDGTLRTKLVGPA